MAGRIAAQLKALRKQTRLSVEELAVQVGAEANTLRGAERGEEVLAPAVLARCAMLAGLEPDEFRRGGPIDSPPTALLRAAVQHGRSSLAVLRQLGVPLVLGELTHRARGVEFLDGVLDRSRSALPPVASIPVSANQHPAEEDALRARAALRVPDGPIPSMRALLERYGVLLVWSTPDEVPEELDGASLRDPIPTILTNLRYGREAHGRIRMTLAHELGHLLFDHLRGSVAVMYSPSTSGGRAGSPIDHFGDIETQAQAFAACFLAPARLVEACVGARAPDTVEALRGVGEHFGVHRTVALNRLQDVFHFSRTVRQELEHQARTCSWPGLLGREDVPRPEEVGLRRGHFRARVVEALDRGLISRTRAWSLLGLPLTESLPEASTATLRAPLITPERAILDLARRVLDKQGLSAWSPLAAVQVAGGWQVRLTPGIGRPYDGGETLTISESGDVLATNLPAAPTTFLRSSA